MWWDTYHNTLQQRPDTSIGAILAMCYAIALWGEVAERLMAPLSKSGSRLHRDVGSNPSLSATVSRNKRLKLTTGRGAGVAEQARLEIA